MGCAFYLYFQVFQKFCDNWNPVRNHHGNYKGNKRYVCTRRMIRSVSICSLLVVLITTAYFYTRIVFALRRGSGDLSKKKKLTYTFVCLWAFWFLQSAPFAAYDFYDVWTTDTYWIRSQGLGSIMAHQLHDIQVSFLLISQISRKMEMILDYNFSRPK